jgi:hypothetical protein
MDSRTIVCTDCPKLERLAGDSSDAVLSRASARKSDFSVLIRRTTAVISAWQKLRLRSGTCSSRCERIFVPTDEVLKELRRMSWRTRVRMISWIVRSVKDHEHPK